MLDDFTILHSEQVVQCSRPRGEISLGQHKYKIAFRHETTGREIQLASFLCDACNSIPQPGNSIPNLRRVLRIVSVLNKLFNAIEAQ